jgi:hypothetical protein
MNTVTSHDWTEDFSLENGNYSNICCYCGEIFQGQHRRVYCKLCAKFDETNSALNLAKKFHDIYERLAPSFGYKTRPDTKEFNPDSPNGQLMIAVCKEILSQ